ncbi:MAG: hypothetical protein FJZ13_06075, partial [Candidatus Omnitrophica bacterium]|nr:hypothetical protein [Candidatus Omnitrophota bacterium]
MSEAQSKIGIFPARANSAAALLLLAFFCLGMGRLPPRRPAPDTTPPVVSITSPLNNASLQGIVNIEVKATDNKAVNKVEFYIDGSLKSYDNSLPYSYSWDASFASSGKHTLKVIAYDNIGNSASKQIEVNIINISPPPPPPPQGPELTISSATASSYSGAYSAAKAIDKSLSTYWMGKWSFF